MDIARSAGHVEVIPYRQEFRQDFERLNLEWIEQFFVVEEADREVFADPHSKIIVHGGQVFFVLEGGVAKGTCAVVRHNSSTYELAKMAVTASARGRGFGDLLMRAIIDFARDAGAEELILSSNTKLAAALRLYEKYGFQSIPHISDERYKRVDIMMRLSLR